MKPWMKILMWFGLGGGIGFFAGYQVGQGKKTNHYDSGYDDGYSYGYEEGKRDERVHKVDDSFAAMVEAANAMNRYSGGFGPSEKGTDEAVVQHCKDFMRACGVNPDEDPEMPEEVPVIGDEEEIEEVPELHPQHMIPRAISEQEYYDNPNRYDQESLLYYTEDQVLFNKDTRKAITSKDEMDEVVGIGMLFSFYKKDGEVLDAIFVENATMGVIFRIDRIDAAYDDPISGANADEYEEDDTE